MAIALTDDARGVSLIDGQPMSYRVDGKYHFKYFG